MQHLGQLMNPRDDRNWMIPRPNTKRRQVYDMLVAGKKAGEIMSSYAVRTFRRVGNDFVEVHA